MPSVEAILHSEMKFNVDFREKSQKISVANLNYVITNLSCVYLLNLVKQFVLPQSEQWPVIIQVCCTRLCHRLCQIYPLDKARFLLLKCKSKHCFQLAEKHNQLEFQKLKKILIRLK